MRPLLSVLPGCVLRGLQSRLLRRQVIYLGQRVVQLQHVRAAALVGAKSAPLGTA